MDPPPRCTCTRHRTHYRYALYRGRDLGSSGDEGGVPYAAAALSLVLHSANPHLPTFRSDVRYFECQVQFGCHEMERTCSEFS